MSTAVVLPIPPSGTLLLAPAPPPAGSKGRMAPVEVFQVPTIPFTRQLHVGDTVGICVGNGSVAVRVFHVDAAFSHAASLELVGDAAGMALGALRLVARHAPAGGYAPPAATGGVDDDTHLRWAALFKVHPPLSLSLSSLHTLSSSSAKRSCTR